MDPVRCLLDRAHSVRLYLPTNLSSDALWKPLALNTVTDFEAVQKVIALGVSGHRSLWCTSDDIKLGYHRTVKLE